MKLILQEIDVRLGQYEPAPIALGVSIRDTARQAANRNRIDLWYAGLDARGRLFREGAKPTAPNLVVRASEARGSKRLRHSGYLTKARG